MSDFECAMSFSDTVSRHVPAVNRLPCLFSKFACEDGWRKADRFLKQISASRNNPLQQFFCPALQRGMSASERTFILS